MSYSPSLIYFRSRRSTAGESPPDCCLGGRLWRSLGLSPYGMLIVIFLLMTGILGGMLQPLTLFVLSTLL